MTQCERYRISGHVQGVGFRAATARVARDLALCGWVRNLADGRVELVARGSPDQLEQLTAWLQRGPGGARVTQVERVAEPDTELTPGFHIR
jgi:acylphosphatase